MNKPFAFVLMPFDSKYDDIYKLGIKAAAEDVGIIANRVDEQIFHREGMLERIYNQINAADLIIADMSGKNANVFYEVGYAHAKGKICVLLTSDADDIPFDLKHQRHIVYGSSISGLRDSLKNDLESVKMEIRARENPVVVELKKVTGDLLKTDYSATAKIGIYLDLHNRTNHSSSDIDVIYFYTGKGWSYQQDGQECAQTNSDLPDFTLRHLIRSPIRRLTGGAWAQTKIIGEKNLGYKWEGELKDSYHLTGRSLVRVITNSGVYDYPLNMDIKVDEIPF